MRYPTEAKHGAMGYRPKASGLSVEDTWDPTPVGEPYDPFAPQKTDELHPLDFIGNPEKIIALLAAAKVTKAGGDAAQRAFEEWLKKLNKAKVKPRPLSFARPNPLLIGFGLGVGLGLIVFGWGASDPEPDESVGPLGWSNADWTWDPCTLNCGVAPRGFTPASGAGVCPENSIEGDCTTTGHLATVYPDPDTALAAFPAATWLRVNDAHVSLANKYVTFGNLQKTGASGDVWTQTMTQPALTPGHGTVIRVDEGFPEDYPIHQFASVPRPKTRDEAVAEPGTQPSTKPDRRTTVPDVYPLPPFPPNFPFPVVVVPPGVTPPGSSPLPTVPPVQIIEVGSGGGGVTVTQSPGTAPEQEPPGKKTKERKIQSKTKISGVYVAVNIVTESLDFIDSIYEGIPKEYKNSRAEFCSAHDYKCKLEKIWKYQNEIDFAVAWEAFVNNALEDMVFGLIGGQVAKANQAGGITTGTTRATQHEQGGEASLEMEGQDQTGPLPVLTYDPETGEWGLAWEIFGLASPTVYVPGVKA